jgi:hypothetical protein
VQNGSCGEPSDTVSAHSGLSLIWNHPAHGGLNVGVHGKPVELHMEKLWDRNVSHHALDTGQHRCC